MYETNLTPEGHEFYVGMLTDWLGDTLGDWQATQIIVQEHFDHSLALREKAIEEIRHVKDDPIQPLSMLFEGIVHPPQENGLQHFN